MTHEGPAVGSARVADLRATVSTLPRSAILHAADSERLQRLVQSHGRRVGAARFVAGESLDSCVAVLRKLNDAGLYANTTLLGEAIPDADGAAAVTAEYEAIIERLVAERLKANVALKLTHLGLSFDEELAFANVGRLVSRAEALGTFVRIDMEQSDYVEVTLRIYERLRDAGHDAVGTVLQSYLYRTMDDLERLLPREPNLRIVKGAYLEPESIAYPEKADVDRNYLALVERGLRGGAYIAAATHDEAIIRSVQAFAAREGIARDRFEFQMLYGVRPGLQRSIAAEGYKVLVASPFGPDWYPYLMRRLAERPANLGFFLKNLVRR
jgi:proline dehydrogenase